MPGADALGGLDRDDVADDAGIELALQGAVEGSVAEDEAEDDPAALGLGKAGKFVDVRRGAGSRLFQQEVVALMDGGDSLREMLGILSADGGDPCQLRRGKQAIRIRESLSVGSCDFLHRLAGGWGWVGESGDPVAQVDGDSGVGPTAGTAADHSDGEGFLHGQEAAGKTTAGRGKTGGLERLLEVGLKIEISPDGPPLARRRQWRSSECC